MAATPVALFAKDNASGLLNAGISASATSIVLQSGNGANFPQPYTATATSGGSATLLNSTGIGSTLSTATDGGKYIYNLTDGSVAVIVSVAADSLTCIRLLGGTTNVWNSSDRWVVSPFVGTLAILSGSTITQSEEVLIIARSTDTLTVATGGRGYNGTTAASFSSGDSFYLFVTAPIVEKLKDVISVIQVQVNTNVTNIATNTTNIGTLQDGTYHYVVATGSSNAYVAATPALAAYTAGNLVAFKANHTNTGSATLNLNSLGAKTIKKNDGATNLAANDIISGQIVVVRYDGTNFQMLSPIGTPATITHYAKVVHLSGTSSTTLTNPTSDTAFDTHTYTVPANDIVSGVGYEFEAGVTYAIGAGNLLLYVMCGSTVMLSLTIAAGTTLHFKGFIAGTAAAGASVAVRVTGSEVASGGAGSNSGKYTETSVATNGTLALQFGCKFDTSNGGNNATVNMGKFTKVSTSAFA